MLSSLFLEKGRLRQQSDRTKNSDKDSFAELTMMEGSMTDAIN